MMEKEIYDLCRRYQYFYKAHREIKDVALKYGYHSPQLNQATVNIKQKLDEVKDELCVALLRTNAKSVRNLKISTNHPSYHSFISPFTRTYTGRCISSDIEIECDGDELGRLLAKAIYGEHICF